MPTGRHNSARNDARSSQPPHAVDAESVLAAFASDRQHGLDNSAVAGTRSQTGYNELAEEPPVPVWKKFLGQFKELVILILVAAAIVSGALGEWTDALAILAIVLLNGLLGFLQERKAERALAALQKLSAPQAKVIRNGALTVLPARELVPGDLISLEAGDNIPADARLIESFAFTVQESALTGESLPVEKETQQVLAVETPLADRRNMAYMGTVAAAGKAKAVVVATGMSTELGRIAGMLQRYEIEPTPLQKRLAELGKVLVIACLGIVVIVFALQLLRGGDLLEVFLLSVSLAVAAVPEGLPAVVTIALALGLQRMIRRNALIRRLPSVETLGSVTVICSDKTGTLTRNEMTVREVLAGGQTYEVTGAGYSPHGDFLRQGAPVTAAGEADLMQTLIVGVRCNNARLGPQADSWQIVGDPTEGALLVAGLKAGVEATSHAHQVLYEIPFDSDRKAMSVVVRESPHPTLSPGGRGQGEGRVLMYTKGAPEVILAKSSNELRHGRVEPLSDIRRREIMQVEAGMTSKALRVLGFAYRPCSESPRDYEEANLVFAGLMGMIDPPREEAKEAVRKCHDAGIRPIMITGDHPGTARAIAYELGIATPPSSPPSEGGDKGGVITGQDLTRLSDDELAARVEGISVYARVAPEHKLRIVQAWKSRGEVVAMTGDGVNDAPAVKAADIGIAMGITGSDVTKEASSMVLTDDNFASIVNAVEEGRGILDNIQKFLHYLLSSNTSEVLFMLFAALVGWPTPLLAVQILWINLVSDGLPALALAMEPPERDIMRRKPRPPREPILRWGHGLLILSHGTLIAGVAAVSFAWAYEGKSENLPHARTVAFCVIAYAQLFYAFACRSQRYTLPELGPFSNPYLFWAIAVSGLLQLCVVTLPYAQPVFEAVTHFGWEWAILIGVALVPVTVIELIKLARHYVVTSSSRSHL